MIGAKGFGDKLAARLNQRADEQMAAAAAAQKKNDGMAPVYLAVSIAMRELAQIIVEVTR